MPLTRIETCKPRSDAEVQQLMQAVYEAQVDALGVPAADRQLRYNELRPEHVFIPPGRTENFTIVTIQLFAGRSVELKQALYRGIVSRFASLGIAPSDVFISLEESPRENWSLGNGVAASEL
jgi:phenylpyruvate tautomerase PptA (4-oxalocrotonate tautomerase family)